MVDWMQRIDAQRTELRELNELTTSRLEGRLEGRFDQLEGRFDQLEARFDQVDQRFARVESRLDRVEAQADEFRDRFTRLEVAMERVRSDVIQWAFGFWLGSLMAMVGTLVALNRLSL